MYGVYFCIADGHPLLDVCGVLFRIFRQGTQGYARFLAGTLLGLTEFLGNAQRLILKPITLAPPRIPINRDSDPPQRGG